MKKQFILWGLVLFFTSLAFSAIATTTKFTTQEAQIWANHKGQEILDILSLPKSPEKYAALDKIMLEDIDLKHAARFVLGKYWKQMSQEQRNTYIPLFQNYVRYMYRGYSLDFVKGEITFTVDKVIQNANNIDVWCTIKVEKNVDKASQGGFNVLFTLIKSNNIKVHDLKIGESSFLVSLRDRFYNMIHENNDDEIDWFLEDFEQQVRGLKQKSEQNLDFEED